MKRRHVSFRSTEVPSVIPAKAGIHAQNRSPLKTCGDDKKRQIASPAKSSWLAMAILLILSLLWTVYLLQGLVMGDQDDWDHYVGAYEMPWNEALGNLFSPWSKSKAWSGFADIDDQVLYRRVFPTVIYKTLQLFPGHSPFLYHFVFKGIPFITVLLLLSYFLKEATSSIPLSSIAVFCYALMPVHYMQLFWISDYAVNILALMLIGIFTYFKFLAGFRKGVKGIRLYAWLLVILICGFLGMRTRDTAVLLPLVLGAHFLFQFRLWKKNPAAVIGFLLALGLIMFQLVPLEHLQTAERFPTQFKFENLSRILFRNYDNQYENEPRSAFFSTDSILPVSIARTLGFFSLWTLVLFILLYLSFPRKRESIVGSMDPRFSASDRTDPRVVGGRGDDSPVRKSIIQICLVWLCIEIPLMGLYTPEPRYFSPLMTPLTVVVTYFIQTVLRLWPHPLKKILAGLALFSFVFQALGINLSHIFFLKTIREARYYQMHEAALAIYQDWFQQDGNSSVVDLARFYCLHCGRESYRGIRLDHLIYHSEIGLGHWLRPEGDVEKSEMTQRTAESRPYIISKTSDLKKKNSSLQPMKKIPGYNPNSFFYQTYLRWKKKKPAMVYLYKMTG